MIEYFLGALILIGLYLKWCSTYWSRKGVKGPSGIPIFGNMLDYILGKKHYGEVYADIYNSYPNATYVGFYRLLNEPSIIIRDLDLVKDVLVRNFNNCHDNFIYVDEKHDVLAAKNPFIARGDRWKVLRNQIAPIFTPSKVKGTFPYIHEVCKKLETYIAKGPENKFQAFEAKDLCSKYTLEVVASCAFGLEGETFTNPNSDFCNLCEKLFQPNFWSLLHTIGILFLPSIGKLLNLPYIPEKVDNWLRSIIREVINRRDANDEHRTDFLQGIIDLKDKNGSRLDETTTVGHSSTFLLEGFETSSTLMSFCLYQLAINPEIQKRVHEELDSVLAKYDWKLSPEALHEMNYMESVLFETLRMHPALYAMVKECTETFDLPPQYPNSKSVSVPVGTSIILPVVAIHYDPLIYKDPHTFNPDRFSEANIRDRNKYAFLSFGEGPRICLGMKFGLAQSKAGLITILSKYNVRLSPKTKVPLLISPKTFLLTSKDGIWINFERRLRKI